MKKIIYTLLATILLAAGCTKPEPEPEPTPVELQITWAPESTAAQRESIRKMAQDMTLVEGGSYYMGVQSMFPSLPGYDGTTWYEQSPVHLVTLSDFMIGRYEVTLKQWYDIMGDGTGMDGHYTFANAELPMSGITCQEVDTFLARVERLSGLRFRLPTEAEWEYAARGGNKGNPTDRFSGAYYKDEVAWNRENSELRTHLVGQLKPNALGLYDMSGNVSELCSDIYAPYSSETQFNPHGPTAWEDNSRVVRGGDFDANDQTCRVYYRRRVYNDENRIDYTGLRLVMNTNQ